MPIDQSTEPAAATHRRTFLARTAVGGALVTAGALASPLRSMLPFAGAQDEPTTTSTNEAQAELDDETFSAFAAPLELAAVQGYATAISGNKLTDTTLERARLFTANHQATADLLTGLLAEDAAAPTADPTLTEQLNTAVGAAGDEAAVAAVLADLEDTLAATYLLAIESFKDSTSARTLGQIAATESQQAALMGAAAGTPVPELTPIEATTQGALVPSAATTSDSTTTTSTTAAN